MTQDKYRGFYVRSTGKLWQSWIDGQWVTGTQAELSQAIDKEKTKQRNNRSNER